jgi:hypothetical protein
MTKLSRSILSLVGVMLLLAAGSLAASAQPGTPPIDHYKVYNTDPIIPYFRPVMLKDQFGEHPVMVTVLEHFANPVDKNGEGMIDPFLHYAWWRIDSPEPPRAALVGNQFGQDQEFRVFDGVYLLNPAIKHAQSPTEPLPSANHYKCYRAIGQPVDRPVVLTDQFNTRTAVVLQPELLCNPAEKTTADGVVYPIVNPFAHLACYRIEPPMFYGLGALIHDQFFFGEIRFKEDWLLCVPSTKNEVVPTEPQTWGRVKALYR